MEIFWGKVTVGSVVGGAVVEGGPERGSSNSANYQGAAAVLAPVY
jgi:hypothetical protein